MSLALGMKAQMRSMVFVAGEPIPNYWPMRAFIHHNPLHGLERLSFEEAVVEGKRLFHGKGFLPRSTYQRYLREGKIDSQQLLSAIQNFTSRYETIEGVDLQAWLCELLTECKEPVITTEYVHPIVAALRHGRDSTLEANEADVLAGRLCDTLIKEHSVYETLDLLFGTGIGDELDELVIKACLDFFDEGQSVWQMPEREQGFFSAWREVAKRNSRLFKRGRKLRETLAVDEDPEGIIVHVMESLKVPQSQWVQYFRRELSRLHGWAGFIRWRSNARHYYQGINFPGDLVDLLAIRLTLSLALISEHEAGHVPCTYVSLQEFVEEYPVEAFMRVEFHGKTILPAWAQKVGELLYSGNRQRIEQAGKLYLEEKYQRQADMQAESLRQLAAHANASDILEGLADRHLARLIATIHEFEQKEGMIWLEAMEATAMKKLLGGISLATPDAEQKRPFAQALFCIDTRSERLRRHLESVGDYQTFGIAGFFGVPVSFMELGKGNETHLCPVLLTPRNLVMEMSVSDVQEKVALSAMEKAVHELKESVLSPFVTVEAIGLLFGFDMVGKTLAPRSYNRWRSQLYHAKPHTHLLIDKLSREQADSIVRAVQRAVIAKAVEHELGVAPEEINDDLVRELREAALDHTETAPLLHQLLDIEVQEGERFIDRLRTVYRINTADSRLQMERLGRIGFTLDEQVVFVSQALRAIGLTENFSRFVLVVGHGSQSENNPYESALDCGACGGNLGLYNARIFAQMANKPTVRKRLQEQGIIVPDDAWFVPAMHNTTTDEVTMHDLDLLPSSHPVYLDRLQNGLAAAGRLCTQERLPSLNFTSNSSTTENAGKQALRNAMDWSQVRPEWGLSRNVYFIIGRRTLTRKSILEGRAFLHSYDYRLDPRLRLLENILTGPLVVGQWINMEHYFSTVDNEHYGSGSKVYHNVAGRIGVMTGNLSDLRTGLPAQTVLADGRPYHEPMRLITVIEAPVDRVITAINQVAVVRRLMHNGWIRIMVVDPETGNAHIYQQGQWQLHTGELTGDQVTDKEEQYYEESQIQSA